MGATEDLLRSMPDEVGEDGTVYLTIDPDTRAITVPSKEKTFGVETDKDSERKYFRCPRIVGDNIDLSQHKIYISYVSTTSKMLKIFPKADDSYWCDDVAVDGDYITFSWKLSGNVFKEPGFVAFKVLAKKTDGDVLKTRWNTAPAFGTVLLTVPDGESVEERYPDIVTQLLERMDAVEAIATEEAMQGYVNEYLGEHPVQLDETLTDNTKAAPAGVVGVLKGDLANLSYEREKYLSYSTEPKGIFKFFYRPVKKGTLLKIKINATTNTQYVIRFANSKDDTTFESAISTRITNTIYEVQNNWNGCVVWCTGGTLLEVDITICEKISNINSVILDDENLEVVEIKNKALSSLDDMPTTRQIVDYDGYSIYVIEKTVKNMVAIKANANINRIGYANDIVNNSFVYDCYDVKDDNSKVSCENDYKYIIVQCASNYTVIATTVISKLDKITNALQLEKTEVISKLDKITNALQLEKTEKVSITKPGDGIFYFYPCAIRKGSILTIKKSTTSGESLSTVLWLTDGLRTVKGDDVESISFQNNNEITYITKETWGGFTTWGNGDKSENYEFDIEISQPYRPYKRVGNEVVICASNSDDKDKNIADFICDGVNDEVEINKAIEMMNHKVGTVTLCDGDYYIDKFSDYTISGSTEKVAICMNKTKSSGVTLTGCSSGKPQKAVIHLNESAFNDIPSDVTPSLIGGGSPSTGYIGGNGFNLKHVKIELPNANHKCIAVNYQHMYWGIIDSCSIYCDGYGQNVIPTDGLVGVRGWAGWSDGSIIGAYDTYVSGFRVGFQLGGEHVICKRLGTRFCYTSYTFGEYPLDAGSGAQVHPITLINCCDEHQATLPKFYNSGNADSRNAGRCQVDFIGFNLEYYPLIDGTPIAGAMEEVNGGWVGRIEYSVENNENNANVTIPFWENGHGKNFRTLNTAQVQMGTTALRNTFAPNYMQSYYDTDLNKVVFCKEPSTKTWIDANGNVV
ncbi:MAG: hypothetical protein ACI4E0_04790 [Blautia sp.]